MPKPLGRFSVRRRSKKGTFTLSLYPPCGLPPEICQQWQRKSFSRLPPELYNFHHPTSKEIARSGAEALIELLKKELSQGNVQRFNVPLPIGDWLVRFISLDNNPRAERLISEGSPYSPATLDLYRVYYGRYIKGDPFLDMDLNTIDVPTTRAFMARVGMKKKKQTQKEIAGTRAYEITINFVRMAFTEYWEDHRYWQNPFDRIDPPRRVKERRRDVLQEDEIIKLFMPGIITDTLERAVAIAMFWAGLRRAEIFGLKTMDLDWKTPKLNITHAWKLFGSKKKRTLGDPKWHKLREAPFPEDLQRAIKVLQEKNGVQEFVFSYADGTIPHGKWILERLPIWLKKAGIDVAGRRIVPHSARHSLASSLEAASVPLRYIQDILGHSSLKTTLGYLHTPEGVINNITKKINQSAAQPEEKPKQHEILRIG
jgi:integrase/recombinase XerD